MNHLTKKTALLGLFTSLALILSFFESFLPPIVTFAPGIKIGLPNIIIIFSLYRLNFKSSLAVSFIRIVLSALLFGSAISFIYSAAGATLSLIVMYILKRLNCFSLPIVSILGALSHNLAQLAVASVLLNSKQLIYYLPVLSVSSLISGVFIGLIGVLLIKRFKNLHI